MLLSKFGGHDLFSFVSCLAVFYFDCSSLVYIADALVVLFYMANLSRWTTHLAVAFYNPTSSSL